MYRLLNGGAPFSLTNKKVLFENLSVAYFFLKMLVEDAIDRHVADEDVCVLFSKTHTHEIPKIHKSSNFN